jgi:hypothetical protein
MAPYPRWLSSSGGLVGRKSFHLQSANFNSFQTRPLQTKFEEQDNHISCDSSIHLWFPRDRNSSFKFYLNYSDHRKTFSTIEI